MNNLEWKGSITIHERDYDVECSLKLCRNGDGDSDVPNGTRTWLEIEEIEQLVVSDENGNEPSEAIKEAVEQEIHEMFADGEMDKEIEAARRPE